MVGVISLLITVRDNITSPDHVDPCSNLKPWIITSDDSTHGNLTTPNYPQPYPPFSDCQWEISSDDGDAVVLTVMDLHLEVG